MTKMNATKVNANSGRTMAQPASKYSTFFFDLSDVMNRCETLKQNPERVHLMCQAQVLQIAPDELVIPRQNGFHFVVRSRLGKAAEDLAFEVNRALLRRLFGSD